MLTYVPSQVQGKSKRFTFSKIVIKTALFVRIENIKRLTYVINIPCLLQHKRYYTNKVSLMRVKKFADDIKNHHDVKSHRLITYREYTIIKYIYITYHMMQLIIDKISTFPKKD